MNDDRHTWPPAVAPAKAFPETPAGDTPPNGSQVVKCDTSVTLASAALADASGVPRLARLKHYRLLDLIGRGGMGDVYRAHDEQFNRIVALKVLPADLGNDPTFVRRFQREAQSLAKLSHPNIVPIYTIDEDQGHWFFAMQFVDGESLDRRLRRMGKLPFAATLRIVSQCLAALQAAHDQQLVHRDVKPGNVLLEKETNHVFLVDFGLVRRLDGKSQFTSTGMVMGTVDYMSPEQARGAKGIDHRADLYSLGVMLYHMLSGRLPFEAASFQGMLYSHAYEEPYPLETAAPDVPEPLVALVKQLLAKSPSDRPSSCREVLAAIEPLLRIEVRAQHLQTELASAADDRGSQPLQMAASIAARSRWADRIASLVGVGKSPSRKAQQSLQDELHSAIAAVEQRIAYFAGLKSEGEQLCGELRQQATDDETAGGDVSDVEAKSFHGHAESISLRLMPIEMELNRALQLRAKLGAVAARVKWVERSSKGSKSKIALSIAVAACLLVSVGLVAAIVGWFGRTGNSSGVAGTLPADVFLDDYPEAFVHVAHGSLGKHGSTGYAGAAGEITLDVVVDGKKVTHALSSHPGENDPATVSYDLGGEYRSFTTRVGLLDKPKTGRFQGEMIFRVLGDGRELWRSTSIREHGQSIGTSIDVAGVQRLSLVVECFGPHYYGWAVWLEPKLSAVALPDLWHGKQRLAAGESVELLPLVKLPDDVVVGNWRRDESGALVGALKSDPLSGHARVQLPALPQGDFQLMLRFQRLDTTDANIVFPVGGYSARATFGQSPEGSLVSHVGGEKKLGIANAVPKTRVGETHEAHIVVRTIGKQAEVQVYVDGIVTCDWRGEGKLLSNNPPCAIPDPRAIGLTAWGDKGMKFESVVLQMLSGHAEISRGTKTPESPRDVDAWLLRGREHWKHGEIAAARVNYEQLLSKSPTMHYHRGELAALCLALGDEAEYRRHCQYLLTNLDDSQQPHERLSTLRIVFLVPGMAHALSETKQQQIFDNERNSEWKDRVAILWHYRHGRWQQAIDIADRYLAEHQAWRERAQCMVIRAMALWRSGQRQHATDALQAAEQYIAQQPRGSAKWNEAANALYLQIYYREATQLILGRREELTIAAVLDDSPKPLTQPQTYLEGPIDPLTREIERNRQSKNAYLHRGRWYAVRQQWTEARSDFIAAHHLDPRDTSLVSQSASICLALEDHAAYEAYRQLLEQRLPQIDKAYNEVHGLALGPPHAARKPELWQAKIDTMLAESSGDNLARRYGVMTLYRNGRWQECIDVAEKLYPEGPKKLHNALTWLFRAMALQQIGQLDQSQAALHDIQQFVEAQSPDSYLGANDPMRTSPRDVKLEWFAFDGVRLQIVYREASELILGRRDELSVAPAVRDGVVKQPYPPK